MENVYASAPPTDPPHSIFLYKDHRTLPRNRIAYHNFLAVSQVFQLHFLGAYKERSFKVKLVFCSGFTNSVWVDFLFFLSGLRFF
jgi:hypothetical protein